MKEPSKGWRSQDRSGPTMMDLWVDIASTTHGLDAISRAIGLAQDDELSVDINEGSPPGTAHWRVGVTEQPLSSLDEESRRLFTDELVAALNAAKPALPGAEWDVVVGVYLTDSWPGVCLTSEAMERMARGGLRLIVRIYA